MTPVIAFSVDSNYMAYAKALINSAEERGVSADIFCRGINLTSEEADSLESLSNRVHVLRDDVPELSNKKVLMKKLEDPDELFWTYDGGVYDSIGMKNIIKTMYSELAAYSCHSRFKTIRELLNKGVGQLLCLDADTYINRNIDDIFTHQEKDLYVVPTGVDRKLFHNEGLLLINNTPASKSFFNQVESKMFNGNTFHEWDVDTKILTSTYEIIDIDIGFLDKSYKDKQHLEESHMWSGDGPRKSYPTFQQRLQE